jgi:hypothetical protein
MKIDVVQNVKFFEPLMDTDELDHMQNLYTNFMAVDNGFIEDAE